MKKQETKLARLTRLRDAAIVSTNEREAKINIARLQEWIQIEKQKEEPGTYFMLLMDQEIRDERIKLHDIQKRIDVGQIFISETWGSQRVYLKRNQKGHFYFYIENIPSGWAISQVINKSKVSIDGGQNWTAEIAPEIWEACRAVINHINKMTQLIHS